MRSRVVPAFGRTVLFELENLLAKRAVYVIAAGYIAIVAAVCVSDGLQEGYFTAAPLPILLINFVLPTAVMLIITVSLSPLFSTVAKRTVSQMPASCLIGARGWNGAKLVAGVTFSIIIDLALLTATISVTAITGSLDFSKSINSIDYFALYPIWTMDRHILLASVSQPIGAATTAIITMFISKCSRSSASAIAVTITVLLFEFMFNMFGFAVVLREVNLWVMFEEYYLFGMQIFRSTPFGNFGIITTIWTALCAAPIGIVINEKRR